MMPIGQTSLAPTLGQRKLSGRAGAIKLLVFAALCGGVALAAGAWGGYRINFTPSEPLGLWRIIPLHRQAQDGDLVFICPPLGPVSEFGLRRGYLHRGLCPSGAAPLIKTVVAIARQKIIVTDLVMVDGHPLAHSRLSPVDGAGRTLIPYTGGVVPSGFLFLHSPYRASYDSRYFGPIPEKGLLGLARPVLTFKP